MGAKVLFTGKTARKEKYIRVCIVMQKNIVLHRWIVKMLLKKALFKRYVEDHVSVSNPGCYVPFTIYDKMY